MFRIEPNPTFSAQVEIPVPGADPGQIEMEFRHRTRSELREFTAQLQGRDDLEVCADLVVGWTGVDAPFDRSNLGLLLERYHGAALAIIQAYHVALAGARRKN